MVILHVLDIFSDDTRFVDIIPSSKDSPSWCKNGSVIWATSRENEDSNQPAQLQKLARILKLG